jgi:Xaa-Pro dipeptidase
MTELKYQPHENRYLARQKRLAQALHQSGLDVVALNPGPTLEYLTGLKFHLSERPVIVFISPDRPALIFHPELESAKMADLPYLNQGIAYGEDPDTWVSILQHGFQQAGFHGSIRVGIEPRQLRVLEYLLLQSAAPEAHFVAAGNSLSDLRLYKDQPEISAMKKAVEIAEMALLATLPVIKIGMTERQVASELVQKLFQAGCDPEMPFSPIVSAGPNSANPHASPSDYILRSGDLLVIDWGASFEGYFSDLTRTFALGEAASEYQNIASIVLQANTAGQTAAGPEVLAEDVDRAARSVIERAGYGQYFTHRTGHGLGRESHEEPYIRAGNRLVLAPGMVFTIEPGIYLPNRNGVRIEDNIVITSQGAECLSSLPRELLTLG